MGNFIGSCCINNEGLSSKVIYWEGNTKTLTGKNHLAGEIMFDFPESMVCDSDRFFIGYGFPVLAIDDELKPGKTYFVLPLDTFSSGTLSTSSISAFVDYKHRRMQADLKECPFEYIKGSNGRVLIKIKVEFMEKCLMNRGSHGDHDQEIIVNDNDVTSGFLCSTPELKKEYEQLVRSKDQTWSPNLDSIEEVKKIRYSPYRFIGLEWQEKEEYCERIG